MSDGFVRVAASDELREGGGIQRTVGDREVGLPSVEEGARTTLLLLDVCACVPLARGVQRRVPLAVGVAP